MALLSRRLGTELPALLGRGTAGISSWISAAGAPQESTCAQCTCLFKGVPEEGSDMKA